MAHDVSPPLLALSRSIKNQSSKKVGEKTPQKAVGISDMTVDVFLRLPKSRCLLVKLG